MAGNTISVDNGVYYEHVEVNKTLTLLGQSSTRTIIDGNLSGNVVTVKSPNVSLSGFTIRYSGASGRGIFVNVTASASNLTGNYIINNGYGVYLSSSNNVLFSNTLVE